MRRWGAIACAAMGCGRLGFDPTTDPLDPDADPAAPDANPAALTESWGEDTDTDHRGVTSDTYLSEKCCLPDERTWNYGGSDKLDLDSDAVPLIRFDLSAVQVGSTILSATLRLHRDAEGGNAPAIAIHVLVEDWEEGALDGAAGVASWMMRTASQAWTGAGAMPPSTLPTAAVAAPSGPAGAVFLDVRDVVAGWVAQPASNLGFAVFGSGDDSDIVPREGSDGQRPRLQIEMLPPGQ